MSSLTLIPEISKKLETKRGSFLLILAASNLDMELLPQLYNTLKEIGECQKLDVILHARGGQAHAALRIALLLRRFAKEITFIVPYYCQSAATLLALSGDSIITGDMAIFSPIDPHLNGENNTAISSQDLKLFSTMSESWFGLSSQDAQLQALTSLCDNIFPPSITAFFRITEEMRVIAHKLLGYHRADISMSKRSDIIEKLLSGYHSHGYPITGDELAELGLNIRRDSEIEHLAWQLSQIFQQYVGAGHRASEDAAWFDVLVATPQQCQLRQRQLSANQGQWLDGNQLDE